MPQWNVPLYQLAWRAYRGGHVPRAAFLNEFGADDSPDNVLFIDALLRPTFAPAPQDLGGRRVAWEQRRPEDARAWLRDRLGGIKAEDGQEKHVLLPYEEEKHLDASVDLDFMEAAWERAKQAETRTALDSLPKRRLLVARLTAEGLTSKQIALEAGISPSTVRTHLQHLRKNEELRRLYESW